MQAHTRGTWRRAESFGYVVAVEVFEKGQSQDLTVLVGHQREQFIGLFVGLNNLFRAGRRRGENTVEDITLIESIAVRQREETPERELAMQTLGALDLSSSVSR